MNKANNMHRDRKDLRWQLLTTASALALIGSVYGASAAGNDSDRPPLWIELGGQLEGLSSPQEPFAPPFVSSLAQYGIPSPLRTEEPPRYGLGTEGKISFEPDGSDWIFSGSIRYGRSNSERQRHQQTPNAKVPFTAFGNKQQSKYPSSHVKFADVAASQSERHVILDFQAGKDVGLGLFGGHGTSVVSAGIRIAQFSSKSSVAMHMEPDLQYPTQPITTIPGLIGWLGASIHFHDDAAKLNSQRDFRGLGPSVAWNASAPVAGDPGRGEITLDWGANAAVLFGRQKARGHHQTTILSYYKKNHAGYQKTSFISAFGTVSVIPHINAAPINRMRSVTVPNLGGFAGMSIRYSDVKVSVGYRADFFFGAMDGGIDARKSENRGFYGPFASISVGLP